MVLDAEPEVAHGGHRAYARWILDPRPRWFSTYDGGAGGGEPAVIGAGADSFPRPVPAHEPGPEEDAEPVLDSPLRHPK